MTKKELKKLRSKLPRGYVAMIMKKTAVSKPTILRVMKGDSINQSVIDAAIELAAQHQEVLQAQRQRIDSL